MALLSPKQFAKRGEIPQLILLFGPEVNFIKRLLDRIKNQLNVPMESIRSFSGKDISFETLANETSCNTLFCDRKLIIIKDAFSFWYSLKKDEQKLLEELIQNLPQGTYLVFAENSEITRDYNSHPFIKSIDNAGVIVLCRKATKKELIGWLKRRLKNYGIEDETFLNYLVEISDGSVEVLEKEIEKLVLSLNRDSLSEIRTFNPFEIIQLALAGDWKALEMLDKVFSAGIIPVVLLGAFKSILRRYFLYITGSGDVREFEKRRFDALKWNREGLRRAFLKLIQLEIRLKSSSIDAKKAFEEFIIWLLLNSQKGAPVGEEPSPL